MKRTPLLLYIAISGFFLIPLWSPLWPQGKPSKPQDNQNGIQGIWTQIYYEMNGTFFSSVAMEKGLFRPFPPGLNPIGGPYVPNLWKISKETIEEGPDNCLFPLIQYSYQLNPGGKASAIDLIPLNEKGQKNEKDKIHGIYFLKDDYLMICFPAKEGMGIFLGIPNPGVMRPERFTTSSKPNSTWLGILRRGNLKNQFPQ